MMKVQMQLGDLWVGEVDVSNPDAAERQADEQIGDDDSLLRAAAVAWSAVTHQAVFVVGGRRYSASECAEWWA